MTDACSFASRLQRVLAALPPTWQICYIGYHETGGEVPSAADWAGGVAVAEVHAEESLTGLFGYLLRKVHTLSTPRGTHSVHPLVHSVVALSPLTLCGDVLAYEGGRAPAARRFRLRLPAVPPGGRHTYLISAWYSSSSSDCHVLNCSNGLHSPHRQRRRTLAPLHTPDAPVHPRPPP